jgi:MerR family transcriptional regulator, thiopeptide resistance regulator
MEEIMESGSKDLYQTKEFAKLAGVTVRALHHYDRLGLLKPKQRTRSGYRLYTNRDFGRLEQIVVLKFLGIPLKQIRGLLEADSNLTAVLQHQQEVLNEKRRQLDKAIRAIGNARYAIQSHGEPDWKLFQLVVQEIEMQNSQEWKAQYFSAEARAKVAARQKFWSPEQQERENKDWEELFADAEANLHVDPSGPKGQELAARNLELINRFTGGDPEILQGVISMWEDRANWPSNEMSEKFKKPAVQEFLRKAVEARKKARASSGSGSAG